jgi:hypothetical protein
MKKSTAKKVWGFHELCGFTITPVRPPTAGVSCGGWEGGLAVETGKLKAMKVLKKRAAYPPSAARIVRRYFAL